MDLLGLLGGESGDNASLLSVLAAPTRTPAITAPTSAVDLFAGGGVFGQQVGVGGTVDPMRRLRKVGVTAHRCEYVARHE